MINLGFMLVILFLGVLLGPSLVAPPATRVTAVSALAPADDPERLYADRENMASAAR